MDGGFKEAPELEPGGEYGMDAKEVGGGACWGEGRIGTAAWIWVLELTVETLSPVAWPVLTLLLSRDDENWKPRRREFELMEDDVSADDRELRSWTFAVVGEDMGVVSISSLR